MLRKCFIALFIFCAAFEVLANNNTQLLDKVVAIVNNDVVTQQELNQKIQLMNAQLKASNQQLDAKIVQNKALDALIAEKLELQVAARNQIGVSDKEVTDAITEIAKRNHLTLDKLQQLLQQQGTNFAAYQAQIKKQMVLSKVQEQALAGQVKIDPQEVDNFLKQNASKAKTATIQYHLQDILIPVNSSASNKDWNKAEKDAKNLQTLLIQKTSKHVIQKQFPQLQIADLGWRAIDALPNVFIPVVKGMQAGEFSTPIKAGNGYHILFLSEVKKLSQAMTKEEAQTAVFQIEMEKAVEKWVNELKQQSYIKIMI